MRVFHQNKKRQGVDAKPTQMDEKKRSVLAPKRFFKIFKDPKTADRKMSNGTEHKRKNRGDQIPNCKPFRKNKK